MVRDIRFKQSLIYYGAIQSVGLRLRSSQTWRENIDVVIIGAITSKGSISQRTVEVPLDSIQELIDFLETIKPVTNDRDIHPQ